MGFTVRRGVIYLRCDRCGTVKASPVEDEDRRIQGKGWVAGIVEKRRMTSKNFAGCPHHANTVLKTLYLEYDENNIFFRSEIK